MQFYTLKPLTIIIAVIAIFGSVIVLTTAPTQALSEQKAKILSVSVINVEPQEFTPSYQAFGRTEPLQQLSLVSQIDGEVIFVNQSFVAGGQINQGEVIYQIDNRDYLLTLNRHKSELKIAEANLQLELGEQMVAEQEYVRMSSQLSHTNMSLQKSLMLREPQLAAAEARVNIAQNNVDMANRNLNRCSVISNHNYNVLSKTIYQGSIVNKGDNVGELAQLATLRVSLAVSNNVATRLNVGQSLNISGQNKQETTAVVTHISANLYAASQLRQVYLSFDNRDKSFILGEFISANLTLPTQHNTLKIPLGAIDDGMFWVVTQDKTLLAKEAAIIWQDEYFAIIKNNIATGEAVVVSAITGAHQGMAANIVSGVL
tara:strand:+ start:102144 stop:103262 length:1119 start_codon:yes stop_codon:yes gene_type:complete